MKPIILYAVVVCAILVWWLKAVKSTASFATLAARAWNKHEQWAFITERPPKEAAMRLLLLMLGISVSIVGIGTRAEVQNYPWCAIYSGGAVSGGTNCGFISFEQCMETA